MPRGMPARMLDETFPATKKGGSRQGGEEMKGCLNMNLDEVTWIFLIVFLGPTPSTEPFAFISGK